MKNGFETELHSELTSIFGEGFAGLRSEEFVDRDGEIWTNLTVLLKNESLFSDAELLMKATSAVRRLERKWSLEKLNVPYYSDSSENTGHAA